MAERADRRHRSIKADLNRYELYVDGGGISSENGTITDAKYRKMLQSFGTVGAVGYTVEKTFEGAVETSGTYELDVDYHLGAETQASEYQHLINRNHRQRERRTHYNIKLSKIGRWKVKWL